ncbi:MAG: hypothetical protein ABL927_00830 [Bdellovibrionales bacterium]
MVEHHLVTIPWKALIAPQSFNFLIFIIGVALLSRKAIQNFIDGKHTEYLLLKTKSDEAKIKAEAELNIISTKLKDLESSSEKARSEAKKDSFELKQKIIKAAKAESERIARDNNNIIHHELMSATDKLRLEVILNSTQYAEKRINESTSESHQGKLNDEFLYKMKQGVQ